MHLAFSLFLCICSSLLGDVLDVRLELLARRIKFFILLLLHFLDLDAWLQRLVGLSRLRRPLDLGLLLEQVEHAASGACRLQGSA